MSDYESVYGEDDAKWKDKPHGWVQWKGTDACIDLYCQCGAHWHEDAEFLYEVKCPECGQWYATGCNVALIPMKGPRR